MTKKKKTTKKKQYKCGGCGDLGHNKRACPSKGVTVAVKEPVGVPVEVAQVEGTPVGTPVEETIVSPQVAIDGNADLVSGHRSPNTRPVAPAAPFDCPTCLRVGILALCELEDGCKALRCEYCMNKSPLKSILKWGAFPEDKPASQGGKAADGRLFRR